MKLTGPGKFVLFMLAVGIAIGGWNAWQRSQGNAAGGFKLPFELPKSGGNAGTGSTSGTENANGTVSEISFVSTPAKKDWLQEQITRFNAQHGAQYKIVTVPLPSREAMHSILGDKVKPVLWSPGSPIWPARLSEAWSQKHSGTILDMSDPNGYRVFLRSPLVFLTTKRKARFLRPLLSGPDGWLQLRRLSLNPQLTPWETMRFSHADPLTSSSGMLTLGLIMNDYAQRNGMAGKLQGLARDKRFWTYLSEVERGLVYDEPASGTTKLTKAFLEDTSRYDLITAYESAALEGAAKNSEIAVIYPSPTAVSEHAVSLMSADWVTPQQKEGALKFMQFLGSKESLQAGLKSKFRPATAGSISLAAELERFSDQGFQQSFSTIELPPYEALNAVAYQWGQRIAKKQPAR
ncbi:MAG: hypothetical protein JWN98_1299 [Abditibacteriota bacterium]|nr:hypothetical protein [Abditibacteriota bacterium]